MVTGARRRFVSRRLLAGRPQVPEKPPDFPGSQLEFLVYKALNDLGYDEPEDFTFQSSFAGGNIRLGGVRVDFLMHRPPGIAMNVQGYYYHYVRGGGRADMDRLQRVQLAGYGITLIFLEERDILHNARAVVQDAIEGRDRSSLAQG